MDPSVLLMPPFVPTTSDPGGPGNAGPVHYPSRQAFETHQWFKTTTLVTSPAMAAAGGALGHRLGGVGGAALGAAAGAVLGVWIGNRMPPA